MLDVLLCIENRIYREGLKVLLTESGEISKINLCSQAHQLSAVLDGSHCDLILIDVALGRSVVSPVELVSTASQQARRVPIIALGLSESDSEILQLIEAGAAAFVTKDSSVQDLISTMISAYRGEFHCAPRMARLMQLRLADLALGRHWRADALQKLSQREHHILEFLQMRMSNKQIARKLGLGLSTVKNHVHSIIVKLGVNSRTEAAAIGARIVANDENHFDHGAGRNAALVARSSSYGMT